MTVALGDLDAFLTEQRRADMLRALLKAQSEADVADAVRRHGVLQDDGEAPIVPVRPQ